MDRRSIIRSAAGLGIGSISLSAANTVTAREIGVDKFEEYTKDILKEHNGIKDRKAAVQRQDGQVTTYNNIQNSQDISTLYDSDSEFSAVEEIELGDGEYIRQTIRYGNENIINVTFNGKHFKMDMKNVKNKLDKRLMKAKNMKKGMSPSRTNDISQRHLRDVDVNNHTDVNYSFDDFGTSETSTFAPPVTGGVYADTNDKCPDISYRECVDSTQAAAQAATLGVAWATARAWSSGIEMNNTDLTIEFKGEYAAAATNALASSILELKFFIEDPSGNKIRETYPLVRDSFLGDFWTDSDDFSLGLYISESDLPNIEFATIGMEANAEAAAIGSSMTAISAATQPGGFYDGDFSLDEYIIHDYFG